MTFADFLQAMQHDSRAEEESTFDCAVRKHVDNESSQRFRDEPANASEQRVQRGRQW